MVKEMRDCLVWTVVKVRVRGVSVRVIAGDRIVRLCSVDGGYIVST